MDMIHVYIQEVTRRVPDKMREDIALELESIILDMLADDFTKDNVHQVLDKLGNPAVLASRYRERPMQLIGPKFYDMYATVLKMVFWIVAIVTVIVLFTQKFNFIFGNEESFILTAPQFLGEGIWALLSAFIQVFFWVTIVFIILERTLKSTDNTPLSLAGKEWTPKELEYISYIPLKNKITKGEKFFGLFWTVLWVSLYFNATNIIGIYQKGTSGLQFAIPIFNQETLLSYLILVMIVVALEIFRVAYMAIAQQWTIKLAVSNTLINIVGIVVIIIIASDLNLFHAEFAPYMAQLVDKPIETVNLAISWIKWLIVASILVTSGIDGYNSFRKAKIK